MSLLRSMLLALVLYDLVHGLPASTPPATTSDAGAIPLLPSLVQGLLSIFEVPSAPDAAAVPPPAAEALTSYGSPLIPGSFNFSRSRPSKVRVPQIPKYPQPPTGLNLDLGNTGFGSGAPVVHTFTYADPMLFIDASGNPHPVLRDLGYSGVLGGKVVWTWGDTLIGTPSAYFPTAVDSTSVTVDMRRPFLAQDTAMSGDAIDSLIPVNAEELSGGGYAHYAFGGTNILETHHGNGLIYYLVNHRALGDLAGTTSEIMGAGPAQVTLDDKHRPIIRRFGDHLWTSAEPSWGDVGIALDGRDDNIYVFGHGPAGTDLGGYTYLCRVPRLHAANITMYEYFDASNSAWLEQRLGDGANGTVQITKEMAIFGYLEMNQAAPFWSNWFHKWMFIHGNGYGSSPILVKTADHLQGSWEDHGAIADSKPDLPDNGNNLRYAIMGHPEFDESGRTVVVTWTWENRIYGGVVEWAPLL